MAEETPPNDESKDTEAGEGTAAEGSAAEDSADDAASATEDSGEAYSPDPIAAEATPARGADISLDVVMDVPVNVALRVGQTSISIRQLISLVEGSVIELDRDATDPMDVLVNDTLVARGEIVVVDEKFGVRLTDVVSPSERVGTLN